VIVIYPKNDTKIAKMSNSLQKRGPMDFYIREHRPEPRPAYESKITQFNGEPKPTVQRSGFVSSLWETAVANTQTRMPAELTNLKAPDILRIVCTEAEARREDSKAKQSNGRSRYLRKTAMRSSFVMCMVTSYLAPRGSETLGTSLFKPIQVTLLSLGR